MRIKISIVAALLGVRLSVAMNINEAIGNLASTSPETQMAALNDLVDGKGLAASDSNRQRAVKGILNWLKARTPMKGATDLNWEPAYCEVRMAMFRALNVLNPTDPNVIRMMIREWTDHATDPYSATEVTDDFLTRQLKVEQVPILREFLLSDNPDARAYVLMHLSRLEAKPNAADLKELRELIRHGDWQHPSLLKEIAENWKKTLAILAPALRKQIRSQAKRGSEDDLDLERLSVLAESLAFIEPGPQSTDFFREVLKPVFKDSPNHGAYRQLEDAIAISENNGISPDYAIAMDAFQSIHQFIQRNREHQWQPVVFGVPMSPFDYYDLVARAKAIEFLQLSKVERRDLLEELVEESKKYPSAKSFLASLVFQMDAEGQRPNVESLEENPTCNRMLIAMRKLRIE